MAKGPSAYDLAVQAGYRGSPLEYLNIIQPKMWSPIIEVQDAGASRYVFITDWVSRSGGGEKPPTGVYLSVQGILLPDGGGFPGSGDGGDGGGGDFGG